MAGELPSALISAQLTGNNTVIAGIPGKRIVVLGYVLTTFEPVVGQEPVTVAWQSDSTVALSGPMPLFPEAPIVAPVVPPNPTAGFTQGWFSTLAGQALVLNLSLPNGVFGHVLYRVTE